MKEISQECRISQMSLENTGRLNSILNIVMEIDELLNGAVPVRDENREDCSLYSLRKDVVIQSELIEEIGKRLVTMKENL